MIDNKYEGNRLIVQDGECVDVLYDGDKILRKNSSDSFKKRFADNIDTFEMHQKESFGKINPEEYNPVMRELSKNERSFLAMVVGYVNYSSCLQFTNGKYVDINHFQELTNTSRTEMYTTLSSLKKKHILKECDGKYFINPWLAYKGNIINKVLKTMFQDYIVHSRGNVEWKKLNDGIKF